MHDMSKNTEKCPHGNGTACLECRDDRTLRLWRAAPALLAACEQAVACLDWNAVTGGDEKLAPSIMATIGTLRAAIARATGVKSPEPTENDDAKADFNREGA